MEEWQMSRRSLLGVFGGLGIVKTAGTTRGQSSTESWLQFGYDTANTGHAPGNTGLGGDIARQWSVQTFDRVLSSISVANGNLYFGNRHGVYVLDAGTGTREWIFASAGIVSSTPAVVGGSVYFGSHDDHVYALNAADGTERWTYETGNYVYSSPVVQDETVVVGSGDGNVYALDASSGEDLWTAETGGAVNSSPALVDGTVFVGSRDGKVYALDAADGTEQWTFDTDSGIDASPAVADGRVYVGNRDGSVYALNTDDGTREWTTVTDGTVKSSPAVANGLVYLGNRTGMLYALNTDDGTERWSVDAGNAVNTSPIVVDGGVYVGNTDGNLIVFASDTGDVLWGTDVGMVTGTSPAIVDGTAYVGGADGKVYALREESDVSKLIETPTEMYTPDSPPPEPDSLPPTVTATSGTMESDGSFASVPGSNRTETHVPDSGSGPEVPLAVSEYLGLAAGAGVLGMFTYVLVRAMGDAPSHATSRTDPNISDNSATVTPDTGVTSWLVPAAHPDQSAAVTTEPGPVTAPSTVWKTIPEGDSVATAPAVAGGTAYTVTAGGDLLSVDVGSGEIDGRTELDVDEPTAPVITDEGVFVGGEQGIFGLSERDGDHRWGEHTGSVTALLATESALYVGGDDSVRSFEFETGTENWGVSVDGDVVSIAVDGDTVYAATASTVVALDRTTGDSRWTADVRGQSPALAVGDVLVVSTQQTVSFRDTETGAELGHGETDSRRTAVALAHGRLYHVTDTAVRALDSSGDEVWRTPLDATTSPAVVGETVYVGTDSDLVALDATDGDYRFTHDLSGAESRPVVVGNTVLCATADGALTAITGELGDSAPDEPTSLSEPESDVESEDGSATPTGDSVDGSTGIDSDPSDTVATAFARGCEPVASATVVDDTGPVHVYDGRFVDEHDDVACRIFALAPESDGDDAARAFHDVARQWRGISKNTHIATVVDVGETPRPWVAFDPGVGQLGDQLDSLDIEARVDIVTDLAEAIRTAGMYNVVHGTLRPEVVYLFDDEVDGRTATVADWGLQYAVRRAVGDPESPTPFTAPEQLDGGTIDSRTEVYRLGAVAHYVMTGTEPFTDATRLESAIRTGERTPPSEHTPSLPIDVDDVIATAMATDRDQRFASPYEFKRRLKAAMR